jgi:general secretion pathway protein L
MVREFFRWWLGQLSDLLPERWRRLGSHDTDAVMITPEGPLGEAVDSVIVGLRRNGQETTLGRFRLGSDELPEIPRRAGKPVVLRLGEGDVLGKTLVLPLAAERHLDEVLTFEMDRETPFSAEEVFWSQRIARRDRRTGQLSVRLLLVPRAKLIQLLGALEQAGVRPQRAEIAAGPDRDSYLPLDSHGGSGHVSARRALLWPALACCIVLALAATIVPFVRQSAALAGIEGEIAADRSAAAEAQKLRQEIDQLSNSADLVGIERSKGGRPLAILASLTRQLPGDTYLTDFVQQQGKVTLTGRSAAASRLIAILANGERLRNPTFAAPVTRIAANQLEIFTITAEVVP